MLLLTGICFGISAQGLKVDGKVTDNGVAVIGATILEKGTTNGTITDVDGFFSLSVKDAKSTLVISYVGYQMQELEVGNRTTFDVALRQDQLALEEVVVIGYGAVRKSDLTGSVASISNDVLETTPAISFDQMLQGNAAGVQVASTSGAPGGAISVKIRGSNSISGSSDPLYVIDGFPIANTGGTAGGFGGVASQQNPLSTLNPNDIASIEVLKDASAAAIYGSRGANGVVLITTKKGATGKGTIKVDISQGYQEIIGKYDLLDGTEFAMMDNAQQKALFLRPRYDTAFIANIHNNGKGTDWQEEMFEIAPMTTVALSASGGTEKLKYLFSAGYLDQEGIMKTSRFTRYNTRLDLNVDVNDRLRIGNNVTFSYAESKVLDPENSSPSNVLQDVLRASPLIPMTDSLGNPTYFWEDFISPNPVTKYTTTENSNTTRRVLDNAFIEYEPMDGLVAKVSLGIDYVGWGGNLYFPSFSSGIDDGGRSRVSRTNSTTLLNENTLSYTTRFGKSNLTVLGGFTAQRFETESFNAGTQNFSQDDLGFYNIEDGLDIYAVPATHFTDWSMLSVLGRVNYNLAEKYLFTASIRGDGTSRFGVNNRWGYFPSGSFAWRLSDESFFPKSSILPSAKVRLSYGVIGNQINSSYRSRFFIQKGRTVFGQTVQTTAGINRPANPDLQWEETRQWNLGADVGFFDDRIQVTAEVYRKVTDNLLTDVPLPVESGFPFVTANTGKIENEGVELTINSVNINKRGLKWTTNFNYSTNRNKVLDVGREGDLFVNIDMQGNSARIGIIREGEPIGSFYGNLFDGIWQEGDDIEGSHMPSAQPGDRRFVDVDTSGTFSPGDDVEIIGNGNPNFILGFTNQLSYKGFEIRVFFQGSFGNDVLNLQRFFQETYYGRGNVNREALNYWAQADSSPDEEFPVPADLEGSTSNEIPAAGVAIHRTVNSQYIEDGSFLRLKNLTVAYTLNPKLISKMGVSSLRIFATGTNLLTFTEYTGINPEVGDAAVQDRLPGVDYYGYPMAKMYTFGINLGF